MASNQAPPWPAHGQPPSNTASSQPESHSPHPGTAAYSGAEHAYAHPHPSAFYGHPAHPGHHQHPYYPYPPYGSMPYPPPYAHAPPHAYMGGHGPAPQPGHPNAHEQNDSSRKSNNGSTAHAAAETLSVATPAKPSAKAQKAKAAPKAKATKGSTSSASEAAKSPATSSTAPKTPKVFRFEGSISSESFKTTKSFDLAGVNILNRKPLDTKTALDKLQRRRETHNRVERKRRDCINQLIDDLTKLLPPKHLEEATSKCHRVNVLRGAVSHIKFLNESNEALALSIRSITGQDPPALSDSTSATVMKTSADGGMSMDIDDESSVKEDPDRESSMLSSPSTSRSPSPSTSPSTTTARRMAPPPVIVTDAPSPSTERDLSHGVSGAPDSFSLESRPRSNSFASSVGDLASPRSAYPSSPNFPPSPISPGLQHNGLFPPGETPVEGSSGSGRTQRQLSPFTGESPSPSPSLPPISSLAKLQLQSPSGQMGHPATNEDRSLSAMGQVPGRTHRGASSLPPLTIPEPHHLHPSYHQGAGAAAAGGGAQSSGTGSNRSSLTLSPHSADQPPISPFMLSPLQPRSPSMGPLSSASPGGSPHPHWNFSGVPSPQMYPPHGSPFAHPYNYPPSYGYAYPPYPGQPMDPGHSPSAPPQQYQQPQQLQQPPPEQKQQKPSQASHARHKSLQPEPIFIQEEPWNVQRKRSTSSASGRALSKSGSTASKKRAADSSKATSAETSSAMDLGGQGPSPTSPTNSLTSVTSVTSFPTSPNPKKRTQLASYDEGEDDDDENSKRSKQVERGPDQANSSNSNGSRESQRDSGVMVVVNNPEAENSIKSSGVDATAQEADEDAAQALTSLARTVA
ncbi:hypothetical protein BGZ70_009742 [Mortierella alpina]|uniref:BHLH domain-containing protein n=1 Tax=Mortierella alpina TaxID=64518 RepID=A0A9P6J0K6_MORAP|nr:hypothetical protein BGZ70_009742 [Mortierella alpina]